MGEFPDCRRIIPEVDAAGRRVEIVVNLLSYAARRRFYFFNMKRFFAMWMCWTAAMMGLPGQDNASSIVFENPAKDFGKVMQGEALKHVFSFKNEGTAALEILNVEPSCGCQAASLSAKRIQPGQSGRIEVSVDTAGLTGAVEKSVNITTNDPRRQSVSLSIRADVQPEISVSSPSIFFENVAKGQEVPKEIIITVAAERPIKILSVESSDESVIVKLEPVPDSEGKKVRLIAMHKGDGKIGYRLERAIIKTTSYLTPELTIHLLIRNFPSEPRR